MVYSERPLRRLAAYRGLIVNVRLDAARLSDDSVSLREVVEHPGGVAVLPLDGDGAVWCVRQYRYALGRSMLEIPAGKLEPGEDPVSCALRELGEETGFEAGRLLFLGRLVSSPGISTETIHLFLATGLRPGPSHPDQGELLTVERHSLTDLLALVMRGELEDGKTVAAILKTAKYLEEPS